MISPLLARVLVALAAPALAVSALALPAGAAPAKGPDTPTVPQLATVYPQLDETTVTTEAFTVKTALEDCSDGKRVPGATGTTASYDGGEPTEDSIFGVDPYVLVAAFSFRSAADASSYLKDISAVLPACAGLGDDVDSTTERIRFKVGDERAGYVVTTETMGSTFVTQQLLARSGKTLVFANVLSTARKPPAVRKAVRLTALALKTAR